MSPTRGPGTPAATAGLAARSLIAQLDVAAIADQLGIGRFYTVGWSGGGPHALACAALLSDRVIAAATLAGVAPRDAEGLDWLAGMGEENLQEFAAADSGQLIGFLDHMAADLRPGHPRAASRGVRGPCLARRRRVDDG